jgi:DNA-binding NarL/FixJ family response regulator
VIGQGEPIQLNAAACNARHVLLLDEDPIFQSVAESVCEKYESPLYVVGRRCATLLPSQTPRPKLVLVGFRLSDEDSLDFLHDLHAVYPEAPLAVITGDSPVDVADVVGLAGGRAVIVESNDVSASPTHRTKSRAWAELVAESGCRPPEEWRS